MEANELRIGNWVLEFKRYSKIENGHDIDLMADKFEPIPLTPEILEMCGFKYRNKVEGNSVGSILDYNGQSIGIRQNDFIFMKSWTSVQYLHQLQNLYFALTGEELTINLSEPASLSA